MKKPTPLRKALVLSLAVSLLSQLPMTAAALTQAEAARLSAYEVQLFGKARPQMADESRMRAIENNLFGAAKTGNTKTRLDAMARLLGNSTTLANASGLHPPMAAQMDRADLEPGSSPAPEPVSSPVRSYESASSQTAGDKATELLRAALAKHAEGKPAEAERIFKQVLQIDPGNADANFSLGTMAEQRGDLNAAMRFYRAANASNPSDYEIQDALSAVQSKLNEQQVAQKQAQQQKISAQRKQELRALAEQAAQAYKAGNYDAAIEKLNRVAEAEPNDANAQFALAQAWRGKGDYNRAQGYLNSALAIQPNNSLYQSTMRELQQEGAQRAQQQMAQNDPRPQGEIVPFAPDPRTGGGGPRGGLAGFFGDDDDETPSYGGGNQPAYGWSGDSGRYAYTSSGRGRLGSAIAGSLMGAAVGAFTGRGTPGGVKRGMLQGALMGGMMGLIRN